MTRRLTAEVKPRAASLAAGLEAEREMARDALHKLENHAAVRSGSQEPPSGNLQERKSAEKRRMLFMLRRLNTQLEELIGSNPGTGAEKRT